MHENIITARRGILIYYTNSGVKPTAYDDTNDTSIDDIHNNIIQVV